MNRDTVDRVLDQWSEAGYELPRDAMAAVKRVTRLARRVDEAIGAALASHDLDRGEFDVLAALLRSGPPHELTPTALHQALLISSGGLSKRLLRLEERGLVARRLDPGDRRSLLVALAPEGRRRTAAALVDHTAASTAAVAGLPPGELARLANLLRRVLVHQGD